LEGPIPEEVGSLEALQKLFLNGNRLEGKIPDAVGQLANLQVSSHISVSPFE
jgi:hypothetical protein